MALEATARAGKAVARAGYDNIVHWISKLRDDCPRLQLLIIGQTGAGKSTLINNLLGEEVAEEGETTESATSTVNCYKGEIEGVHVTVYDTPGLGDSRGVGDDEYLEEIRKLIEKETIHLVIYCFRMNESRLHQGIICTFQQYTKIGVDWRKTVIALTFADALKPSKGVMKREGFSEEAYFEKRLEAWREDIPKVLAAEIHLEVADVKQIKINPATSDHEELLPNGKEWYIPFWLDVLTVLPPAALMKFLDIHKANIKYGDTESREMPEWPGNFTLPPPPTPEDSDPPPYTQATGPTVPSPPEGTTYAATKEPTSINVSISNQAPVTINQAPITVNPSISVQNKLSDSDSDKDRMKKPVILLEGENREKFEATVGSAVYTGAGMTVGGVLGATAVVAAGVAAAPVVIAGAAVGAIGAGVTKLLGWW